MAISALSWAGRKEVAGDHDSAQESWRQARSELEPFLEEQLEVMSLLESRPNPRRAAFDKAAALSLAEPAMTVLPLEPDVVEVPLGSKFSRGVAALLQEPERAVAALRSLYEYRPRRSAARVPAHHCAARARPNVDPPGTIRAPELRSEPSRIPLTRARNDITA